MCTGPEFFQTGIGRTFYEGTVPSIARSLKGIDESLKKLAEQDKEDPSDEFARVVDERQRAAMLAGLRFLQASLEPAAWQEVIRGNRLAVILEISNDGGKHPSLTIEEIDELCEGLNG